MRFRTILMDPPWLYADARTHASAGMARSAYECMTLADLQRLPIEQVAAWPSFVYCTCTIAWVKLRRGKKDVYPILGPRDFHSGLGHWTNGNLEQVLFFRRGKPRRLRRDVKQILVAPVGGHSAKPDEARARIEALLEGPYLEIFARRAAPGWTAVGDGIDGRDVHEALRRLAAMDEPAPASVGGDRWSL